MPADPALMPRRASPNPHILTRIGVGVLIGLASLAAAMPWLMPGGEVGPRTVAAAVIFAASYAALAVGKIPGLGIDRAGVALVGACLMVASGAIPIEEAYQAIHLDTLTLLLGMMIIVANLRLSGAFGLANAWIAAHTRHPLILLTTLTVLTGVSSAFLVNDAICLVMAPLVVDLIVGLRRDPVPYLLAVAMASNVGSTATITGNPQNIMIGALSGIPYAHFAGALGPVAAIGLVMVVALVAIIYRREFLTRDTLRPFHVPVRANRVLVIRSLLATVAVIALFFASQPPAKAAIVIGSLLLLTRGVRSARIHAEVDWSLLLMFAGLFIIVAGAERTLLSPDIVRSITALHLDRIPVLAAVTAVLSNLVSNVPAVLVLRPFIVALPDQASGWLTVAMASTLAGNLTVLGSIANLIVVERAARSGVAIGFSTYARVGVPLTLLTLLSGCLWLMRP